MNTEVQELFCLLDEVLEDLAAKLSQQYADVKIDLNISAKPSQQSFMGIPPFQGIQNRMSRFRL